MFWLRNKKIIFLVRTLNLGPVWSILVVQLEQHVIYRLKEGAGQGGGKKLTENDCHEWKLTFTVNPVEIRPRGYKT